MPRTKAGLRALARPLAAPPLFCCLGSVRAPPDSRRRHGRVPADASRARSRLQLRPRPWWSGRA
eukprot:10750454-Alexandrium_andersonii.AAC.1